MSITQHTINTPYMVGPVHCYTTEVEGDLLLFDTGPPTEPAKQYFLEHIPLSRLKYVFLTHCHIDHYGLAAWLAEESAAEILLPYRDSLKMLEHEKRVADMSSILQELGFSGSYLQELHALVGSRSNFPSYPRSYNLVEDDFPSSLGLDFLSCPGHSQSDIVYFSEEWAVTGDVLLKGVFQSPLLDVDLETGERFKNYEAYCATLKKLATIRDRQVLPGHRVGIDSVDETLIFYVAKMLDRVVSLGEAACERNVADTIDKLFGSRMKDPLHVYLKASEVVFMQDFLEQPQILKDSLQSIGLFDHVAEKYRQATQLREYHNHDRSFTATDHHRLTKN